MQRVAVIASPGLRGPRVTLDSCPRCTRQVRLDHVGHVDEDGEYVDMDRVLFAQQLHLDTCRG